MINKRLMRRVSRFYRPSSVPPKKNGKSEKQPYASSALSHFVFEFINTGIPLNSLLGLSLPVIFGFISKISGFKAPIEENRRLRFQAYEKYIREENTQSLFYAHALAENALRYPGHSLEDYEVLGNIFIKLEIGRASCRERV